MTYSRDPIGDFFRAFLKRHFTFDPHGPARAPTFPLKGFLVVLFLLILVFFYSMCLVYIRPNETGIKEVKVGLKRGIQKKVYNTGYHFIIPFIQRIHKFPKDIQVLELTSTPHTASRRKHLEKAAHIQTSDGFYVDVDCSILFNIEDPYKVITTVGPGLLFEENGIIPKAEPILKESLGELTTEDFYNSPLRVEKVKLAEKMLNEVLLPKGIRIDHILVRYFRYSPEIQKNIEEKKLKDQLVFKNRAEAHAAEEAAKLDKVIEEGKANVRIRLQEGKAYVVEKDAERDLYVRKKSAEADLLVKLADAKKISLKNNALQGAGSDRMVGLKMAEVYKGLRLLILPSDGKNAVNPLNVNRNLSLFGVRNK